MMSSSTKNEEMGEHKKKASHEKNRHKKPLATANCNGMNALIGVRNVNFFLPTFKAPPFCNHGWICFLPFSRCLVIGTKLSVALRFKLFLVMGRPVFGVMENVVILTFFTTQMAKVQ